MHDFACAIRNRSNISTIVLLNILTKERKKTLQFGKPEALRPILYKYD